MSIEQQKLTTYMTHCRLWLEKHQAWFATAESITGGGLGAAWTAQSGSSNTFLGSIVAYQNHVKEELLFVPSEDLAVFSAVSESVATKMLTGLWQVFTTADFGISVTGYAEGGEAPGLVWVAVGAREQAPVVKSMQRTGDRASVREEACLFAYQTLWEYLSLMDADKE